MTTYNIIYTNVTSFKSPRCGPPCGNYWLYTDTDTDLDELLYTLEGWIHILGPGPEICRNAIIVKKS